MVRVDVVTMCYFNCFLVSFCLANKVASLLDKHDDHLSYHKKTPALNLIPRNFSQNYWQDDGSDSDERGILRPIEEKEQVISPSGRQPYDPNISSASSTPPCYSCFLVPLAAVAIVVGVAVPLANIAEVPNLDPNINVIDNKPRRIPTNFLTSINLTSFQDDGCGTSDVLFKDGNCYPLLRPCENPLFWTTADPVTLMGRCSPRLCGRERVFVGRDQLCHDTEDSLECTGGRRLFYTAYGDPICDCPIGQYPFPTEQGSCVALFTQGPCPAGQVFSVLENGFGCAPAQCQVSQQESLLQQLVPGGDGLCYPLGTRGPCSAPSELLGYDVLGKESACVNVNDPLSPYFESSELNGLLDTMHKQRNPDFGDFEITFIKQNLLKFNSLSTRRQNLNTIGVFQFPNFSPKTLLNPCRPGPKRGNNYKCANPLVPNLRRRELLQVVRSAFSCPGNSVLLAKGTCGNSIDEANCGPTYELGNLNGRCEKSII